MCGEANAVMTGEGLRGLWRGVLPSLYRTVPGVGLYFSSMHWICYDPLHCRQDQDRIWGLSVPFCFRRSGVHP